MMNFMPNHTSISFHDSACCRTAREWFFIMDAVYSRMENSQLQLSWLYEIYSWGPNKYPFFWCELLEQKSIDCGVFADLVQTILVHRGTECSRLQQYTTARSSQKACWKNRWLAENIDFSQWIIEDKFIYHELIVLNDNGQPLFFDTSTGLIIDNESPFADKVLYIKQCQPMSIPIVYNKKCLSPLEWTAIDVYE